MRPFLAALGAVLVCVSAAFASEAELDRLRVDYAEHFFTPETHLRLALYLATHGDPLSGFLISEAARTEHFNEQEFERAVRAVYWKQPPSNEATLKRVLDDLAAHVAPPKKGLQTLLDAYLAGAELTKAEELLHRVIAVVPDDFTYTWRLAEVLRLSGREAEGDALEEAWRAAHPDAVETWRAKAAQSVAVDVETATATLTEALAKFPDDADLHFHYAGLLHDQKKLAEAGVEYERAADLDPSNATIQGYAARFFHKTVGAPDKALRYYLRAYFADPYFRETETVAARIDELAMRRAAGIIAVATKADVPSDQFFTLSSDPYVLLQAMRSTHAMWDSTMTALAMLLAHDAPDVRYSAAIALHRKAGRGTDLWVKAIVTRDAQELTKISPAMTHDGALLPGRVYNVLSSAAYLAGARRKWTVVDLLEPWLTDPAELLRYDAVSVLGEFGGGRGEQALRKLWQSGTVKDARIKAILQERFTKVRVRPD